MIDIERIATGANQILVYGEITRDDIAAFIAFAKAQLETEEGGNVLFDLVSVASLPSLSAITLELANMATLMKWVYRLDRIAVISDEAWLRAASRIESALLPGVSYAVYDADEADAARAWVLGKDG